MYLLDTNIYISFYDRYYPRKFFPSFWQQFTPVFKNKIMIPDVVIAENQQSEWFRNDYVADNYTKPILSHRNYFPQWQQVLQYISDSDNYNDQALTGERAWTHERIADGWLIAMAKKDGFTIVTAENPNPNLNPSKPSKNPKIPDVANALNVKCIDMLDFFEEIKLKV